MGVPVQARLVSEARRGKIKREDVDFVITAINDYYKTLAAAGTIKAAIKEDGPKEKKELTPAQKAAKTRTANKKLRKEQEEAKKAAEVAKKEAQDVIEAEKELEKVKGE